MANMNQQQSKPAPTFYKVMAVVFFVLAAVFIWAAVRQHSGFYWAFAIITVINGFMSIVKSSAAKEARQ